MYDGRGSVAQTVVVPVAGQKALSALPDKHVKVRSFTYTAFGEQMGRKISEFGYNAEAFDAATGMINLRARQYESTISKFSQRDAYKFIVGDFEMINRFSFCLNDPISYMDSSGMFLSPIFSSVRNNLKASAKLYSKKITRDNNQDTIQSVVKKIRSSYRSGLKSSVRIPASGAREAMDFIKYFNQAKPSTNTSERRKTVNENRKKDGLTELKGKRIARKNKDDAFVPTGKVYSYVDQCANYYSGMMNAAGMSMERLDLFNTKKVFPGRALSTDLFAALVGGMNRDKSHDYGQGLHPNYALHIRIGNEKIPMEINGMTLHETKGMSQYNQAQLVKAANIPLLFAAMFGTTKADIQKGGLPGHVDIISSQNSYSAKDTHFYNRDIDELVPKDKKSKYEIIDIVIPNIDLSGVSDTSDYVWPNDYSCMYIDN